MQEAIRYLTVDESGEGQRLDNFLFKHLKGVPKTHVYRIIRSGEVRRNKSRVQADSRLDVGDELRIPPIRVAAKSEPSDDATLNKPGAPLLDASHFP
ncbi:MAG: S4 domain-containing protein, partial [Burkholderiaceae bacterium]|nr:S4 domain-containing protein [Burkholderiaceae bacterium]